MPSDNFDRANSADLGANWTPSGAAVAYLITSNEAQEGNGDSAEYYNAFTPADDQYAEAKVGSLIESGVDAGAGPAARMATGAITFYAAVANTSGANGQIALLKWVGGTMSVVAGYTAGPVPATGDLLRIECEGTTVRVKHKGVTRITVTDASLASGRVGVGGRVWNLQATLDDWTGDSLSALPAARRWMVWLWAANLRTG